MKRTHIAWLSCLFFVTQALSTEPKRLSGIYPHLTMFNHEGECGTGAVVPFAERLWVITYGPHLPNGSSDKLYEITTDLQQRIRLESVGGTPANRMIHRESNQLLIGPYLVNTKRDVRVVPPAVMPGRLTGNARHLTDPAHHVYYATMEEGLYEVDVNTLEVKTLIRDGNSEKGGRTKPVGWDLAVASKLPGYHGKGLYSGFGKVIYSNNGENTPLAREKPDIASGALGEWDGSGDWKLIRRNQFVEVTGPCGIYGNEHPGKDPIWATGWDYRSCLLMVNCIGKGWTVYRLPKTTHTYDGAHGWNTEWPRIRDIGEKDLLMTLHGAFWRFPPTLTDSQTKGIRPRSSYLKVIGDFARWNDQVVMGCDDSAKSEFLNKRKAKGTLKAPAQSQSNLWFVDPSQLDAFGPCIGRGALWMNEAVKANTYSDAYLFAGYAKRILWLKHNVGKPVTFIMEVDPEGKGSWTEAGRFTVKTSLMVSFAATAPGEWMRMKMDTDCPVVTAFLHYGHSDVRTEKADAIFEGVVPVQQADVNISQGLLLIAKTQSKMLTYVTTDGDAYELTPELTLRPAEDKNASGIVMRDAAIPEGVLTQDAASIVYTGEGVVRRLPVFQPLAKSRVCREICTERDLFNAGGIFYELPAENAGGFAKIRPIASHRSKIYDYASCYGMTVLSGVNPTPGNPHVITSSDGKASLWVGVADDLWKLGKPCGVGGPWKESQVKAGVPSDPYLSMGFDRKELLMKSDKTCRMIIQADIDGTGNWVDVVDLELMSGKEQSYHFEDDFAAYWVRVISDVDCTATAQLTYH